MAEVYKTDMEAVSWINKITRYTDYLGVAQLYLKENGLLRKPLRPEHFKARILGHWGTVPGLNFIYANLNYLIYKHKCEMLFIAGPGHGAPAVLANLFLEGSMENFYPQYPADEKGTQKIIKDFSWPHTLFPSHVTPTVPGAILEGGELGYSLSTAFGAVFDNPDLIVAVVVGDGEAETGPLSAAWHSNKFLNPKTSGAVLPIVHINGYKISNPTIYGTMSDDELRNLFVGYGYEPMFVSEPDVEKKMIDTLELAYRKIHLIQTSARANRAKPVIKPKWPVILLQTPKGWKGIHDFHGHLVEGSFHSHGVPIDHPSKDQTAFFAVKKWLESYDIHELIDKKGCPTKEVLKFIPKGNLRMGMNPHAIGGNFYKALKYLKLSKYEVKLNRRGDPLASNVVKGSYLIRDIIKLNPKNFRILCPDELESNRLESVFEVTKREYMWPLKKTDENIGQDGRAMEMLSEHTLQGWYQGYLLTGRQGIFVSYEAFATIISSMVDQYAKFMKQSSKVPWRKPIASAIYLLSSLGWRQDHNGYSHQNPSFVSNILQKHGECCQIYYPSDANSLLVAFDETFKRKNSICVIVSGKRELPQWLSLKEAQRQAKTGMGIWPWVGGKDASKNPDVVLASAGDYLTQEALLAAKICKQLVPELKIRYVNVSELTSMSLGDDAKTHALNEAKVNKYFTKDKPVIFNYHGYTNDIEQILWPYVSSKRFSLHGYSEKGSTTTPFDMAVVNGVSRYHLVIDLLEHGAKFNKKVAEKSSPIIAMLRDRLVYHQAYIQQYGDDPADIKESRF